MSADYEVIMSSDGFPIMLADNPTAKATTSAHRPLQPAPQLGDDRVILTVRQVSEVLGMSVVETQELLGRESIPRHVGWDRRAVEELRKAMEQGKVPGVERASGTTSP